MQRTRFSSWLAFLAVVAAFAFIAAEVSAAPRMNSGSRGSRTYSAPPPTATAPNAAAPIQRSMTQPGQSGAATAARPAASNGFFNRPGLLGGLAAGFLGAGLFGMLFGHGFLGGLGGFASLLGLLLQVGLVALLAMLAWRWWQSRSQPAAALAGGPSVRNAPQGMNLGGLGSGLGSGFGGFGASRPADAPLEVKPEDFDAFERLLGEIQTAYGAEDLGALRARVTPEMLSYYSEELARNASRGVVNQLSNVKLLQGDLSEAWREGDAEYATLAMRYSLDDRTVERASGHTIEDHGAQQAVELWTFRRVRGGGWMLSAIQQAS